MLFKPKNFDISEFVCPHVLSVHGERAWSFFDHRLLETIDLLRSAIDRPFTINNYAQGGQYDERGCRCLKCSIVKDAIAKGTLYLSAHMRFQAADFDVKGMTAYQVRMWIKDFQPKLPYPIRLEDGVSWVHLDVCEDERAYVYFFKA